MGERPATIYKYESFNTHALINLKAQSIYFGSPRDFNDPYDCAITATVADPLPDQLEAFKQHLLQDPSGSPKMKAQLNSIPMDKLQKVLVTMANSLIANVRESFLNTKGVTCFTECNDDLLMWAHYGGQYKGFCLEFRTDKSPFTKIKKVQYVDHMPKINVVDFFLDKGSERIIDDLFCTKSSHWKYEREWRAIHSESGTLFTYEADALQAVYFGPNIERQALEIVCLIIQAQNPGVQFFSGTRSETQFKVEFETFTYTSYREAKHQALLNALSKSPS
jgi:hypothetical protein